MASFKGWKNILYLTVGQLKFHPVCRLSFLIFNFPRTAESDRAKLFFYAAKIVDEVDGRGLLDDLLLMYAIDEDEYAQLDELYKDQRNADQGNKEVVLGLLALMRKKSDEQVEEFVLAIINKQPEFHNVFSHPLPEGKLSLLRAWSTRNLMGLVKVAVTYRSATQRTVLHLLSSIFLT